MTNVYKQQIVRLNRNEMCVVWPIDASHCAQFNKPTLTPWLEGSIATKEVRGHMQAVRTSGQVVLDILPFVRNQGSQSNGIAKPTEQLQFVFLVDNKSLKITPAQQTQRAIEFVCKPWVKQKWWDIY